MKTINIQARLDIITIANLTKIYADKDIVVRSKSDLVWRAVEQLTTMYIEKGAIVPFSDVYTALEYLKSRNLQIDTSARTRRQVMNAMATTSLEADFGSTNYGEKITKERMASIEETCERSERVASDSDREEYELARKMGESMGLAPISFETFLANKKKGGKM